MRAFAAWILSICLAPPTALAAPGELDPSFGDNGIVRVASLAVGNDSAATVFAQADGALLAGRANDLEIADFSVLRLDPRGSLDSTFGSEGLARTDVSGFDGLTFVAMQQSDGKVVAGGTLIVDYGASFTIQPEDLALARYLSDGRPDTAFGENGIARVDFSGDWNASAQVNAIVEQNEGRLVAGGSVAYMSWWGYGDFWDPDMVLVRFDASGVVDPTFGTDGRVVFDPTPRFGFGSELRWLEQQADGKLVGAGRIGTEMAVARFTPDGSLDASFGGDGYVTIPLGPLDAFISAEALAVQADGKIVIGGTMRFSCDLDDRSCEELVDAVVARLHPDGSLDESFGAGGFATVDVAGAGDTEISRGGLTVEPAGTIIVAGNAGPDAGPRYGFIARLTANGALDTTFGNAGVTLIDVGENASAPNADMNGIVRLADGDVVAALTAHPQRGSSIVALARIETAGHGNPGIIGLAHTALGAQEGADATFVVRRTGGSEGEVSVHFEAYVLPWALTGVATNPDFAVSAGNLLWLHGDTADKTIAIPIAADSLVESAEEFGLRLSLAGGGATLAGTEGRVTITDVNDGAGILALEAATASVSEGDFRTQLRVTRTGGATGAVSVTYSSFGLTATEGRDYSAMNGTLHWAHGDTAAKGIPISITVDGEADDSEVFRVVLSAPTGGAELGGLTAMDVTITEGAADPPGTVSSDGFAGTVTPTGGPSNGGGGGSGALDAALLVLVLVASIVRRRRRNVG
jgi:uncharacterized delta-60 repeat protein